MSHAALHDPLLHIPTRSSQLTHGSPFPVNPLPLTLLMQPLTPEQTAASDRRGAWEVQPTRQANSTYLTSHLAADRHGGSVQVHTPHPSSQQPPSLSMESDLSHGCDMTEMCTSQSFITMESVWWYATKNRLLQQNNENNMIICGHKIVKIITQGYKIIK